MFQKFALRSLQGLTVAFLGFDTVIKVLGLGPAVEAGRQLGLSESAMFWIGLAELVCLILYSLPRTAVLGALLWTGYLGGAVATHARLGSPLFSHTLFPMYMAVLLWAPLYASRPSVRRLVREAFGRSPADGGLLPSVECETL